MKHVWSNHHNEYGQCTQEDWNDASTGRCLARTVRVTFKTFSQAVPITYLEEVEPDAPIVDHYGSFDFYNPEC